MGENGAKYRSHNPCAKGKDYQAPASNPKDVRWDIFLSGKRIDKDHHNPGNLVFVSTHIAENRNSYIRPIKPRYQAERWTGRVEAFWVCFTGQGSIKGSF
jgi:hypothetical protein